MSLLLSVRKRLILSALLAVFPNLVWGQIAAVPQSNEYSIAGSLAGDQIHSSLSLNQNGGYLVWEENGSKKSGSQISAIRLNSSGTKISGFTVNKITKGDQVNPQVQLLNNGNALFVWQSYGLGNADIYARLLKDDGSFATSDIRVNSVTKPKGSYSKDQQSEPVMCALQDGSAFVAWQSFGQDGSMFGIYATRITADGKVVVMGAPEPSVGKRKPFVPNEFLVNETTAYNQRSPIIATLANGNIIVLWISELQRFGSGASLDQLVSVDVYGRLFSATGEPLSHELLLNSGNNFCANPSVAPLPGGGFTAVWSEKDSLSRSNSWEIMGRSFSADGTAAGADFKINTNTYGDQYCPKIAAVGNDCAVVWTSLGQDGSREGIFGRLLQSGAQPSGEEFRVNNTTPSKQIFPAITASGPNQFLVTWSSFVAITGCDLFGRKYTITQQQ